MSKRKKRNTRSVQGDTASDPTTPEVTDSEPATLGKSSRRYGLALGIAVGLMWVSWFTFLLYVALTRS